MNASVDATAGRKALSLASASNRGIILVAASAVVWSFGGAIARSIDVADPWTVVFWRSVFACLFLLGFMLWRDGLQGTVTLFRRMGWPGLAVGFCFGTASIAFVVALGYTTVANIILIYAGAPLLAALFGRVLFGTEVSRGTWVAISAVVAGVAIMVSEGFGGGGDSGPMTGTLLALLMTVVFAIAAVITRQYEGVRMTPAMATGTAMAAVVAGANAGIFAVGGADLGLLVAFGALNLGLGMALFVTGARLIPAALTALIGMVETVLSPLWVWLLHAETPSSRTLVGGAVVFTALVLHVLMEARRRQAEPTRPTASRP
jgi:drug/metabolite transporter (DMT)-like permease